MPSWPSCSRTRTPEEKVGVEVERRGGDVGRQPAGAVAEWKPAQISLRPPRRIAHRPREAWHLRRRTVGLVFGVTPPSQLRVLLRQEASREGAGAARLDTLIVSGRGFCFARGGQGGRGLECCHSFISLVHVIMAVAVTPARSLHKNKYRVQYYYRSRQYSVCLTLSIPPVKTKSESIARSRVELEARASI